MKFQLMIEGSQAAIIAAMNAAAAVDGGGAPFTITQAAEDDDGPTNATPPAVDSAGLPWDERIHSSNHQLNDTDGKWRYKRNAPAALKASVEAELRTRLGAPAAPVPPPVAPQPPPVAPAPPMAPPTPPVAPMVPPTVQTAPPMPLNPEPPPLPVAEAPAPAPPAPPAAPTGVLDFPAFMQHIGPKFTTPDPAVPGAMVLSPDYLARVTAEIATAFAQPLNSITDVGVNPQMVTYAMQAMQRDGKW